MDESFVFYMDDHENPAYPSTNLEGATMEVPNEFYDKYFKAFRAFYELNAQVEQLYRIQLGKEPWALVPIPAHRIIDDQSKAS